MRHPLDVPSGRQQVVQDRWAKRRKEEEESPSANHDEPLGVLLLCFITLNEI